MHDSSMYNSMHSLLDVLTPYIMVMCLEYGRKYIAGCAFYAYDFTHEFSNAPTLLDAVRLKGGVGSIRRLSSPNVEVLY